MPTQRFLKLEEEKKKLEEESNRNQTPQRSPRR